MGNYKFPQGLRSEVVSKLVSGTIIVCNRFYAADKNLDRKRYLADI